MVYHSRSILVHMHYSSALKKPANHLASCSMSSSVLGFRVSSASTLNGSGGPEPEPSRETDARSCGIALSCFSSSVKTASFCEPANRSRCKRRGRTWKWTCGTVCPDARPSCDDGADEHTPISQKKTGGAGGGAHLACNGEPLCIVGALDNTPDALDGVHELGELVGAQVCEARDRARGTH